MYHRQPVSIIAEAGVNHNGSLSIAFDLVDAAAAAGSTYIKFQTFFAEKSIALSACKASYQKRTTGSSGGQLEMVKKLQLSFDDFRKISARAREKHIGFMSSPFDIDSLNFLCNDLQMETVKVGSGEVSNIPFLINCGATRKDIILSSGMSFLGEIELALAAIVYGAIGHDRPLSRQNLLSLLATDEAQKYLEKHVSILHCTTEYPTPPDAVNLRAIKTLRRAFPCRVGFSDHTKGIHISISSIALGAEIIEKHFTIDKSLVGPDHQASIDPIELRNLVTGAVELSLALGKSKKIPSYAEIPNRDIARKFLVATRPLRAGEIAEDTMFAAKRTANGVAEPLDVLQLLGKPLRNDYDYDQPISE
jgi:N-acetylneuraminate synthase